MALNWQLGEIADWDNVCQVTAEADDRNNGITKGDRILSQVTQALIWATMSVDLGKISTANHEEFFSRLRLLEMLEGPRLWRPDCDRGSAKNYITLAEVKAHIGLATNVTTRTQASWAKRLIDQNAREQLRLERQKQD
jgi:hypothetical protein